jgi:hypothetical protein
MGTQKVGKILVSHEYVLEYYSYDPNTGILIWKKSPKYKPQFLPGRRAGYPDKSTLYRRITCQGKEYAEHRFIWFLVTGENPELEIDHIDGNPANNS